MGFFSSNSSWTNQAKNSGSSEPRCAPVKSMFLSNKSWGRQANNAAKAQKANRGTAAPRTLMGHVDDLKKIQKQARVANQRSVSQAANKADAAFRELDRAMRRGNPGAIKRAQAKASKAQRAVIKAQRAARRGR